jgi:lipopolysaccharide export system protein LptA
MPASHGIATTVAPQRVLRRRRVVPRLAALFAVLALGSLHARAQGLNLGGDSNDNRPIDITADSGLEWQQQAQVYIARGNAVATRGTSEVHADTLTAHYRQSKSKTAEGGNEVYRLDADGHVVLKGPTQTVVGDQAVYDLDQQIAVVTGKALKLTTPTDVVTARDSLEWYDATQIAVARGDAVATRGDKHIRADVLTAHMTKEKPNPAGDKPGPVNPAEIKSAATPAKPQSGAAKQASPSGPLGVDAQGNVVAWNATDVGRGDYGVYNADTAIVTLLGNVTITRGQDVIRGNYAVLDLNTNVSRMMTVAAKPGEPAPRVEGLFFRQDATTAAPGGNPATGAKSASSGGPAAGAKSASSGRSKP